MRKRMEIRSRKLISTMHNKARMDKNSNNGITLIALVVTIIVLIILAGISINLVLGENGIITKAKGAKDVQTEAEQKEKLNMILAEYEIEKESKNIILKEFIQAKKDELKFEEIRENTDGTYTIIFDSNKIKAYDIDTKGNLTEGVNWDYAMSIMKAPQSQDEERNNGVIGIGTDGNAVDMDLWEYTLLEDGTYGLNDEISILSTATAESNSGYKSNNIIDGKIIGTVPQYISTDGGNTYFAVTSMRWTFFGCQNLTQTPKIPNTVTDLSRCFQNCTALEKVQKLPDSILNMARTFHECTELKNVDYIPNKVEQFYGAFTNCEKLESVGEIPDTVTNMTYTFYNCKALKDISRISANVVNLNRTFYNCESLGKVNLIIPSTATDISYMFLGCININGKINVESVDNISSYEGCFRNVATQTEEPLIVYGESNKIELLERLTGTTGTNSNIKGFWE